MTTERRSRVIQVRDYDYDDESSEDDRSDVFSNPNHNKGRYYQGCSDSEESDTESSSDNEDKGPRYWCLSTSISMSGYFTLLDSETHRVNQQAKASLSRFLSVTVVTSTSIAKNDQLWECNTHTHIFSITHQSMHTPKEEGQFLQNVPFFQVGPTAPPSRPANFLFSLLFSPLLSSPLSSLSSPSLSL
jgi:hypothetical protein